MLAQSILWSNTVDRIKLKIKYSANGAFILLSKIILVLRLNDQDCTNTLCSDSFINNEYKESTVMSVLLFSKSFIKILKMLYFNLLK